MDWFENEQFWIDFYPYMFGGERFERAVEQLDQLLALLELDGGDVLDLCCGPGRHSVELARLGFRVTGVDRTPFLLDKARRRAAEAGVEVEFIEQDMRRFARPESYDLALSMFTSFGYFETEEEDLQVLGNLCRSLRAGGRAVVDVSGKEHIAARFLPANVEELEDGNLMVQHRHVVSDWTRLYNEWILITPDEVRRYRIEHFLYSGRELKDRMLAAGFAGVSLYGDFAGAEYGPEAPRLIAVGSK